MIIPAASSSCCSIYRPVTLLWLCRNIAFITDPDGYWIEILEAGNTRDFVNWNQKS